MLGSSITKIARPRLSGVSLRDRLFHLLDEGRTKPVTWVGAPAGSGKTTLIASWLDARNLPCLWYQVDAGDGDLASFFYYMGRAAKKAAPRYKKSLPLLKPEYLQSVPLFTRRYFEELFQRLKPPATIVFDNYQDAPSESGFHEMFAHALETVPEGINVVVLSRTAPPSQLARLQANNLMQFIGWEEVRFTREESGEVLKLHGRGIADVETAALLHEKTEGWAAGMVLLMAGARSSVSDARALGDQTPDSLFDYFASELFNRTDAVTQNILLETSFLQRIEPADAEHLTGNGMAGHILERLSRNHYFTQKYDRAYQYHPLFRNFLQTRARHTFSSSDIARIQGDAALLLEKSGQPEEAIRLYIDACDWSEAQRLLLAQASMLVAQGRSNTLDGWLRHFPQELVGRSAWLLYWTGICRMAFDPQESRGWLEKAFELFKPQREPAGAFLSWASIVDTFVYEWHDFKPLDHWIAEMEHLLADNLAFPTPEIEVRVAAGMLSAMVNRQPGRSDLPLWSERVVRTVMMSQDVQLKMTLGNTLIFYYLWAGDFSKLGVLMDALRPPAGHKGYDPLTLQLWYVMEAMHAWFAADWKTCQRAISDGVKNADDSGIHLLDLYLLAQGVYGGLSLGDTAMAEACFEKMSLISSPRTGDKALHQYQASSIAWQRGDFKKSAEHGKLAAEICEEMGWTTAHVLCLMELAVTYFDDNRFEEADACLGRALDICRGSLIGLEFGICMNGA
ncbi:MAG: hypothetical protein OEV23_06980, partial [Gallionella sp.]|nr:hypothetical protein [Gallionella sp.]